MTTSRQPLSPFMIAAANASAKVFWDRWCKRFRVNSVAGQAAIMAVELHEEALEVLQEDISQIDFVRAVHVEIRRLAEQEINVDS